MKSTLIPTLAAAFVLPAAVLQAKVLDDFNDNVKTNWTDFTFIPGFGVPVEANGQFKFNLPPAGQSIFAASTKTSETFTLQEGRTIEFSVDLVHGNGADSFAVLAFIPKSSAVSDLAGYAMSMSTGDFLLSKGINKYFYNETQSISNDNVRMVLTLKVKNGSVYINGKVLDNAAAGVVLFEQSAIDTPEADILADGIDSPQAPYLGEGNFVLFCYEDNGTTQASYEVTFDNAETFVCDEVLVDNFDDNVKTQWQDFTFIPGFGSPVESGGQFKFNLPPAGQPIFAASTKTSPTFELTEGNRLEFKVDLLSTNGHDAFAVMGFIPSSALVSELAGYTIAKSSTDILLTKGINKYFYNDDPAVPIKNENVRLILTLTMRSGSVIINGKVLDMDAADAVIFDQTVVDTPEADFMVNGTDSPQAPYFGPGNFVLFCYEDGGATQASYEVTYDNAFACRPPLAGNTPPVITEMLPESYRNFLPPATTQVSFKATDDKPLPDTGLSISLNGTVYTTANGLVLSGPANERTVSIGGLQANVNYTAVLRAADSDGAIRTATIPFDTFAPGSLVIEAEDFNFNAGSFWDNPDVIPESTGPVNDAYANVTGFNTIDYNETRTSFDDVPYRPADPVRMIHSLDFQRAKFAAAGGIPAGVYDYDVGDFEPEEWTNYTRTFPAGTYDVYLRQAITNMPGYTCMLERVTGDRTQPGATTVSLGSFMGTLTGFRYGNTPLTDIDGESPTTVTLSGVETLRLWQADVIPGDASVLQNYLIFIPRQEGAPFEIASVTRNPAQNSITFSWPSEPGRNYKVEASSDLGQWTTLAAAWPSQGASTSYTDMPPAGLSRRTYRVTR